MRAAFRTVLGLAADRPPVPTEGYRAGMRYLETDTLLVWEVVQDVGGARSWNIASMPPAQFWPRQAGLTVSAPAPGVAVALVLVSDTLNPGTPVEDVPVEFWWTGVELTDPEVQAGTLRETTGPGTDGGLIVTTDAAGAAEVVFRQVLNLAGNGYVTTEAHGAREIGGTLTWT